ncbi:MAG: hypothetical protein A2951_02555 [Candidatus Buchananbacteria bacterium RIFCSPLOWO2_01_FULL_56_15]|uniref:riboflavin kinase n=1 Tax=Candidatus Buchananbacteria bacterium RIFCSPLOWO2_01_FULL_56_15 TaxID=1797547 RepID=A0A1G1YU97_9BACT|nr:MAG: hypothetical protein A2951_02555 [Candidatus Buchananbacteria bacterium RIFCSPLOWO2_01_FULL_56_15]
MSLVIEGRVRPGRQVGRQLGFPTINIAVPRSIRKRQWGIYASLVKIGESVYPGVTHLGPPKTFHLSRATCETFLLTLRRPLADQRVSKRLLLKLREVEHFSSIKQLKRQMGADVRTARKFFGL